LHNCDQSLAAAVSDIQTVRADVDKLRQESSERYFDRLNNRTVRLDFSTKAYQRLETDHGTLYIAVENVEPYANGQRVTLEVGNPMSASFAGYEIHLAFGDKQQKNERPTMDLRAGRWTRIPVIFTPLAADKLDTVFLSMTLNQVSLLK
jgi:hypothetical protein